MSASSSSRLQRRNLNLRLGRRALLRGLGGVAVALPALEIMGLGRKAHAAGPGRFVLSYAGVSTGAYRADDELVPATVGRNYDVKRALKPLADANLRDDVSVVTGLIIPWAATDAEPVPPGGRSRFFHFNTQGPMLAGTSTPAARAGKPRGPTADQLVANAIAGATKHKVLTYRVQATANHADAGRLSWKAGPNNTVVPQEPIASPRLAYQSLFTGFVPPAAGGGPDPAETARLAFQLRQRKSVLDFVSEDMNRLLPRLGSADRTRLQRHFDELRGLEGRLQPPPAAPSTASCRQLAMPPADPAVSPAGNYGYSGEDQRADVLTDLIAMAFACDLSRVASFMITEWKCYMNVMPIMGIDIDMHELTHGAAGQKIEVVSDSVAWHVKQWGKLITKLKALPEPGGGNLLDSTALVLLFEGGHGFDPEGNSRNAAHSTENMSALIAGRAGGLKPGQHLPAKDKHPANVVISAMNAAGVPGDTLGEVKGNLPGLFA
jgi:hypothetical protein